MERKNIKVFHKNQFRRFNLPSNATWMELEAQLRTLFSIPALTPFTLTYEDEDKDVITLSTDMELQATLSSSAPAVKFDLKFSTPQEETDSDDSISEEAWILEGGNILSNKVTASISTIESDNSGLQDNLDLQDIQVEVDIVLPNNNINATNREPQYSHDKTLKADDDLESDGEKISVSDYSGKKIPILDEDSEKESTNKMTDVKKVLSKKKIPISDEDSEKEMTYVERVLSNRKKAPILDEDSEKESSNEITDVGKVSSSKKEIPISDEDSEKEMTYVERVLSNKKKAPILDEDSDEESSNEMIDVGKVSSSKKKIPISDEDSEKEMTYVERVLLNKKKAPILDEDSEKEMTYVERSSSKKKTPILDEDLEKESPNKVSLSKKTSILDDEFFDSFDNFKLSTQSELESTIESTIEPQSESRKVDNSAKLDSDSDSGSDEDEEKQEDTIEASSSSNRLTNYSPIRNQSRQDQYTQTTRATRTTVDLEQFQMLIEQHQDIIEENPQLIASINDTMDQIKRSIPHNTHNDLRPPIHRSRSNTPSPRRANTPPINRNRSITPTYINNEGPTTPPIPGTYPQPPKQQGGRGGRRGRASGGRGRRYHYHQNKRNNNRGQQEKQETSEGEGTQGRAETPERAEREERVETPEPPELVGLAGVYPEQVARLKDMGFKFEQYAHLIEKHDGDFDRIMDELVV